MSEWDTAPHHLAYRTVRENVSSLVEERPGEAGRPVPACPGWTVRDAVAHLVEICWKVAGRSSGEPGEPFPVDELTVAELLDRWADAGPKVERLAQDGARDDFSIMVMDAFTHELDLRSALGVAAPEDHPAHCGSLDLVNLGFAAGVQTRGLPALRLETEGACWQAGSGPAAATVTGGRYDLFRSLTGRRTLRQIGELSWFGSAEPWSPAFAWGPFRPPADPAEGAAAG